MLGKIKGAIRRAREFRTKSRPWSTNEQYVHGLPSAQETIDIFEGTWSSELPIAGVNAGPSQLFDDVRIKWLLSEIGSVEGWNVLELGPLEAGHTAMLDRAGVARVDAIEGNKVAYLKCLVVKELLDLKSAHFELGDFDAVLRTTDRKYDLIIASGVLYHMADPLRTILNMTRLADTIFIWSHFFDDAAMPKDDPRRSALTGVVHREVEGDDALTYHSRSYMNGTKQAKFCGGSHSKSVWIERGETIALLESKGYKVQVAFDEPDHVHGPAACLLARR